MKKRKIGIICIVFIVALLLIVFSDPIRAIRIAAILNGCSTEDVMRAEWTRVDVISPFESVYRTDNTVLPDGLTGSGHQVWFVYRFLFLNIPVWAGNA